MKKGIGVLIVLLIMGCLYSYQRPIMTTEQAMYQAESILMNPQEAWGISITLNGLVDVPEGNISGILTAKKGFWNEWRNNMQWEITIKTAENEYTVAMDARTGQFIDIWGPFS